jgi:hypothetical protein
MRELFRFCRSFVLVAAFVGILLLVAINTAYMLISPRAWFRLPGWLRKSGSLTEDKYSAGWGAIQVRVLGAVGLTITIFMLYGAFIKHR